MKNLIVILILAAAFSFLSAAPGDLIWNAKTGSGITSPVLSYDKYVYIASLDKNLYAYNSDNGILKWKDPIGTKASICIGGSYIFCGHGEGPCYIFAYDAISGASVWSTTLAMISEICYDSQVLYVAGTSSSNNKVMALNANNGASLWEISMGQRGNYCPTVKDQKLFVGTAGPGELRCYDKSNGSLFWSFQCGIIRSKASTTSNYVYFGSTDTYVYCLNSSSGSMRWNYKTKAAVWTSPCIWEAVEILYIGSRDSTLYALDTANGGLLWTFKTGSTIDSSPFVKNGYVYFGSSDYNIYALNATNGQLAWSYRTGYNISSSPYVNNGVVYIGSLDTFLYAIETYGYTGFNNNKSASYLPAKSLTISPNPFSSRLSVSLPSSGAIYSLTGQLIMKLDKGKHSLDTSSWKQGVYIVKAGKETKRIVKIKN